MEIHADNDDDVLLPTHRPSSPPQPKLKRLKKAAPPPPSEIADKAIPDRDLEPEREVETNEDGPRRVKSAKKRLNMEEDGLDPLFSVPDPETDVDDGLRKVKSAKKRLNVEDDAAEVGEESSNGDGLGPLFSVPDPEADVDDGLRKVKSAKKRLNMEDDAARNDDCLDPLFSVPEPLDLGWEREDGDEDAVQKKGKGVRIDESVKEKSVKKRLKLGDEGSPKKRKRTAKPVKLKDSVRETKRTEKDRKAQLERIHAESQRLLRETKDASFKPTSVAQKPISSVLEKIRLRKLEVMRQCSILQESDSYPELESPVAEASPNRDQTKLQNDAKEEDCTRMAGLDSQADGKEDDNAKEDDNPRVIIQIKNNLRMTRLETSDVEEDDNARKLRKVDLKSRIDAKEDDSRKMDDCNSSQLSDRDDNPSGDDHCNTSEDILVPSLSVSNSKLDPADDPSSDDEDNDKENISPCPDTAADMEIYPKGGPAKVFLDDEAEEEDDSDHDLLRFEDNEDDESDDDEELDDLIATGFEEAPVDNEKRNQLHQKWLEQQDTAATDNFLQKLKCREKQRDPTLALEEDDEEEEVSEEEGSYDLPSSNVVHKSSRKAKQMFAQMFNDGNDNYVPSDDEETEQTLIRQRFLKQTVETSLTSPLDDDNSREVFGLIKKLNVAPITKKKAKSTSSFDMMLLGGNSNSSSKSSFLGRTTSNPLPSSHKQGPASRAFIFGRDDSNSRSNISTSENAPDTGHKENQAAKTASTKLVGSQFKQPASVTKNGKTSGPGSLFDILRQSSAQYDMRLGGKDGSKAQIMTESQVAQQFSVFKLGRKFSKVETRI